MTLFHRAAFVTSIARLSDLPRDTLPEIAFAGRSNVGKSSAINALCGRKRLAFVSKTPGRTQMLNLFSLDARARLVDLPGYGYAKVPQALRAEWDALVGGYLAQRRSLAALVLIMDARRPFTPIDRRMIEWARPIGCAMLVLLSKADKLSRREAGEALALARRASEQAAVDARLQLFSSLSGAGVEETRAVLEALLDAAPENKNPR